MKPKATLALAALLALAMVLSLGILGGCRGGRGALRDDGVVGDGGVAGDGGGSDVVSPEESASNEPIPGVTAEVWEVRHDAPGVIRIPASPDQRLIVGTGEVTVNLRLPKGTTLEAIKPYLVLDPGEVRFNTAEWEEEFVIDILWPDHEIPRIGFNLKQGAPLGGPPGAALVRDFTLTIDRRPTTASFTIAEVGNERVAVPYTAPRGGYDLAAGSHTFRISFSKAMDHASVEAALTETLAASALGYQAETPVSPPSPTFRWTDDQTVRVSLEMDAGPLAGKLWGVGRHYLISPNGAVDKDGVTVSYQGDLWLAVKSPVAVFRVPAAGAGSGAAEPVLTLDPGLPVIDVDRGGQRFLTLEDTGDNAVGDSGDAPPFYLPRLLTPDKRTEDLYRTTGGARDIGFCDDGRLWAADLRQVTVSAAEAWDDPSSCLKAGVGSEFIFDALAVSGDGWTAAYLVRSPGQDSRDEQSKVTLDLWVFHPRSPTGRETTFKAITKIPAMADFYGPPLGMAIDRIGKTLIFNDLSVANHPLTVVDLETGEKKRIVPPADIPVAVPIAGFQRELAISPDGKTGVGVVSDRVILVDLAAATARSVALPKGFQYLASSRPFSSALRFSPDGALLAFQVMSNAQTNGEARVMVFDLAAGTLADRGPGRLVGWSGDGASLYVVRMPQ